MPLPITRLIFFSSSIRCSWVGRRPAVSTMTTSMPRALPDWTASNATAAGSPDSCAITVTLLRWPQTISCSRAAARKVSPAASSTDWSYFCMCLASLPMVVVLPAPLTPAIIITSGSWRPSSSGFSSGRSRSVISTFSAALTAAASSSLSSLTLRRRPSSRNWVASMPASAISSADSSSSYRSSSILAPTNSRLQVGRGLRQAGLQARHPGRLALRFAARRSAVSAISRMPAPAAGRRIAAAERRMARPDAVRRSVPDAAAARRRSSVVP